MRRGIPFVVALALLVLAPSALAANSCVWGGATSTDWATSTNWTSCGGAIPGAADGVTIGSAANEPVISAAARSANITLNAGASLSVTGGSLTVGGQITVASTASVSLSAGTLSFGTLQVANNTGLAVTGGSLSGTLNATAPSTLSIAPTDYGSSGLTLGGSNVVVRQTDDVTMQSGSTLAIGNGTFQLADTSLFGGGAFVTIGSGGTLEKLGGIDGSSVQPTIDSSGLIEDFSDTGGSLMLMPTGGTDVLGGTLKADPSNGGAGLGFGTGNFQVASGGLSVDTTASGSFVGSESSAHLALAGHALTISASSNGFQWNSSGAQITGAGTIASTAPGGYVSLAGGATLAPGTGNTMTVSSDVEQIGAADMPSQGTIQLSGRWFTFANLTDSGGTVFDVVAGGILRHVGGTASTFTPPVIDSGTVEQYTAAAANWAVSNLDVMPGGTVIAGAHQFGILNLTNLSAGTLAGGSYSVASGATLGVPGPLSTLSADLTLNGTGALADTAGLTPALAGLSTIADSGSLTLAGNHSEPTTLSSLRGSLVLSGTSGLDTGGATTAIGSPGILTGTGTLTGNVSNGGTVSPGDANPGTLTIAGDYAQAASGTLSVKANGTGAGLVDLLSVQGNLSLGGHLTVAPSAGYASSAAVGDSLDFLHFTGTRSGTFAAASATPPLAGGKQVAAQYDDVNKRITAVVGVPPAGNGLPTITGSTTRGSTLSATTGTWSGSPTSFTYVWQDCDASASACADIAGASGSTLVLAARDVGHRVRVVVTASNSWGGTSADSAASAVITAPVSPSPQPPRFAKSDLNPSRFTAGKTTTLSFTLSEPARVTGVITQSLSGRRVKGRCKATAKKGRRCTLVVHKLTVAFSGRAGGNSFRLAVSRLKPGSYTLTLTARDAAGRTSKAQVLHFKIIQAVKKQHHA